MTKLDYFKLFIQEHLYRHKANIIAAFAIVKQPPATPTYVGQIFKQPWGYAVAVHNPEGSLILEPIEGTDAKQPLFTFKDRLLVDQSWIPNAPTTPTETCIGNVIFNAISILTGFGPKFPFIFGKVSVGKIEDMVAPKLQDTPADDQPRSDALFYADEYVRFVDTLQFISNLSQLTAWSATAKSLLPPQGLKEFKTQLLEKYKGKLTDPIELVKYEQELLDFDKAYLQDDPAYGKFLSGKVLHTARKKMFLSMGADKNFTDSLSVVPVTNSLQEGWSTDPIEFTAMMNGVRSGSYSRGAETVKGGVAAKILLRAANNYTIQDTDCQSSLGITRVFTSNNILKLVGRSVIQQGKSILIATEEQAQAYINRKILVRSPMYCRMETTNLCRVCAGEKLFKFPTGVTIPLTEISSIILATSLKQMHSNTLSTAKLEIDKHFT